MLKRLAISAALAALWAWGAATQEQTYKEACDTDAQCEAICRAELRPDEDPAVCDY